MTMELRLTNNNNHNEGSTRVTTAWPVTCKSAAVNAKPRPKRDFHFQVIQVHQGPKWFIWPTKKERRLSENAAKKESIDKANNNDTVNNNSNPKTTTNNRKPLNTQNQSNNQQIDLTAVDGQLTPVTASSQPMNTPTSEPTTRRLSTKSHKAQTEPISASAPSSTFKILSICKKWEESLEMSDDELDDLENCLIVSSCRQMSRSLDHVSQSTLSSSPPNSENQVR